MNLPDSRTYFFGCAFLILCLLVLPLPFVSARAATAGQQTSAAGRMQNNLPASSVVLKVPVTVVDKKGNLIPGLTKEEFTVWEGKTEREIKYFNSEMLPASIAVLIDGSGSMQSHVLSNARYAAARFLTGGHPANEYLVGEFSDRWRSLIGWARGSQSAIEVADKLMTGAMLAPDQKSKGRGQTALYDACGSALDALSTRSNPRRILLLITDGQDNRSRLSFARLLRKVISSDVQIYSIGIAQPGDPDILTEAGQAILNELAAVSGGRAYFPQNNRNRKDLDVLTDRVAAELRHQYVIGFTPTNAAPGDKWNKVKIKVTPRNTELKSLRVYGREGYFSPSPHAP